MRKIDKQASNEPQSLKNHRSTPNTNFDGLDKSDLQDALLREQFFLCAYCMCRINKKNINIEHYKPKSKYNNLELIYSNLFGVCDGGENIPLTSGKKRKLHCDKKKANQELLKLNPLTNSVDLLYFTQDGTVKSSDSDISTDIKLLGLNEGIFLKKHRANLLKSLQSEYSRLRGKSLAERNNFLRSKKKFYSQGFEGKLPEYCQVALQWIEKKL
ncbi:retron system putative HNH endonuclease [Flammeovirga sp. OC4]|uniref:retron system putative HNH endonuclease n=1 Tax=Flammeovirga sp. OC4 TaxID=1382345 RepID=UPI0005C6D15B|nr:retron system putative HNH endonuclease [Flammeovirga sp. OC4]